MTDWMIAIEDPNSDAPVFDGPKDTPIWDLYAQEPGGTYFGEWEMARFGHGLTHAQALELARALGFEGGPIGG